MIRNLSYWALTRICRGAKQYSEDENFFLLAKAFSGPVLARYLKEYYY